MHTTHSPVLQLNLSGHFHNVLFDKPQLCLQFFKVFFFEILSSLSLINVDLLLTEGFFESLDIVVVVLHLRLCLTDSFLNLLNFPDDLQNWFVFVFNHEIRLIQLMSQSFYIFLTLFLLLVEVFLHLIHLIQSHFLSLKEWSQLRNLFLYVFSLMLHLNEFFFKIDPG